MLVSKNLPMTIKVVCVDTIINYYDTRTNSPRFEGLVWYTNLNGIINKNIVKYLHPNRSKTKYEYLIIDTQMASKTIPYQYWPTPSMN